MADAVFTAVVNKRQVNGADPGRKPSSAPLPKEWK